MNRRSFLKIAGAAGILTVTPISIASALAKKVPIIYGDGIHCDSDGLQAALNGKDFVCAKNLVVREGNKVHISHGRFLIEKTVTFDERTFGSFTNSHIRWKPSVGYEDAPMFVFPHTGPGCRFPIGP